MTDPILIDLYSEDRQVDWPAYLGAGLPFVGAIFKLCEGLDPRLESAAWAHRQRQAIIRHERYGVDVFDGFYPYLLLGQDGRAQAERTWTLTQLAGGELAGTLPAAVDVESADQRPADLTHDRIVDVVSAFAERYHELSGRRATLYGGNTLREHGVRGLLGCGRFWTAYYGSQLGAHGSAALMAEHGLTLDDLALWQYQGTEAPSGPPTYPRTAPGCAPAIDLSAAVCGLDGLRAMCARA